MYILEVLFKALKNQNDYCQNWRSKFPMNKRGSINAGIMLAQRHRRWPNMISTSGEHIVFAGRLSI